MVAFLVANELIKDFEKRTSPYYKSKYNHTIPHHTPLAAHLN